MESSETTVNSENMAGNSEAKRRNSSESLSAANHTPNADALKVSKNLCQWFSKCSPATRSIRPGGPMNWMEMHIHVPHPTWIRIQSPPYSANSQFKRWEREWLMKQHSKKDASTQLTILTCAVKIRLQAHPSYTHTIYIIKRVLILGFTLFYNAVSPICLK